MHARVHELVEMWSEWRRPDAFLDDHRRAPPCAPAMPGPGVNDVGGYLNRYKSRLAHVRAPVLSRDQVTFDLGHARDEETQRLVAARAVSIDPVYDTDTQPEPVASSRKRPAGAVPALTRRHAALISAFSRQARCRQAEEAAPSLRGL